MRLPWLLTALVLSIILAGTNLLALHYFWYWQYRWLDTPMHFLGGLAIGIFAIGVSRVFRPWWFLVFVVAVAVGWEVFEYVFRLSTNQPHWFLDTAHDLLNDAIGAILAYVVARFTLWRSH